MWLIDVMPCWGGASANAAVTLMSCPSDTVSWQVMPLQPPLKPEKSNPAAAVVVSVTDVPSLKLAVQVVGQLIPVGLLVTLPLPVTITVNCACCGCGGGGEGEGPLGLPPQAVKASTQAETNSKSNGRAHTKMGPENFHLVAKQSSLGCFYMGRNTCRNYT